MIPSDANPNDPLIIHQVDPRNSRKYANTINDFMSRIKFTNVNGQNL